MYMYIVLLVTYWLKTFLILFVQELLKNDIIYIYMYSTIIPICFAYLFLALGVLQHAHISIGLDIMYM